MRQKNRLLPEMESLLAGLIALDPARAAVLVRIIHASFTLHSCTCGSLHI